MRILATFVSVLIVGTLSFTIAQEQKIPSKEELFQSVPQLSNIPGLSNFNTSSINTDEYEKLFKDRCEKNGGPNSYTTAKASPVNFATCVQSLVNVTEVQAEMTEARPKGELDTVFSKYCKRVPIFKKCVRNATDAIEPCLETEERDNVKVVHNITSSLLQFICHNEGDRIAMFIAAGGIECFNSTQKEVAACANETFGSYAAAAMPKDGGVPGIASLPLLVLGVKECTDIEHFRSCAVKVLEECTDPTPANVVDSLLNFVKRVTPCENLLKSNPSAITGNSAGRSTFGSTNSIVNILIITITMLVSYKFA